MTTDPGSASGGGGGAGLPPQNFAGPVSPADPGNANVPASQTLPALPTNPSVTTTPSGGTQLSITVGGHTYGITLDQSVDPGYMISTGAPITGVPGERRQTVRADQVSVQDKILSIQDWYGNATKRQQIIDQMYAAGLITSKKNPGAQQVATAWAIVVQEAALEQKDGGATANVSPEDVLTKAAQSGWNSINAKISPADQGAIGTGNANNAQDASTTSSSTIYKSYLDPATIMGAQADAWFRLMGRNPTSSEYQAFLNSVYQYQDESNTGKFETKTTDPSNKVTYDPSTGQPVSPQGTDSGLGPTTATSTVDQRGIGTRGLQFLAGQAALANPEEGAYQAATTYFNAFIKALSGPAAGMQASGPTTTIP